MEGNQKFSGSKGMVWVNGDKLANIKSFEAKVTADYDDVKIAGEFGTDSKYMGYSLEGTMTLHKIDSKVAKLVADGFKTGKMPSVTIVSGLDDPDALGMEKVEIDGVKFTELALAKWEIGQTVEEEVPFKAKSFKYLELV